MKVDVRRWFILDENAHHFYHHHKTKLGYLTLEQKMHYTIYASLVNAFMSAVLQELETRTSKGEQVTNAKWGAIQNKFQKQVIEFSKAVNEVHIVNVKIPHSRMFRRLVSKYAKQGYVALLSGRLGNQHAKSKEPNKRIEHLKELYLQGYNYKELNRLTGYSLSTIRNYRKLNGWAKIAKWENGNRRNTSKANKPKTTKQATAPPAPETDKDNVSGCVLIAKWNNSNYKSYRKFLQKHHFTPSKDGKQTGGI